MKEEKTGQALDDCCSLETAEEGKNRGSRPANEAAQPPSLNIDVSCDCCDHDDDDDGLKKTKIARLVIGGVIFAFGFLIESLVAENLFAGFFYVKLCIFLVAYLLLGSDVLLSAGRNILRGQVFDENFLMGLASLAAFVIGEFPESCGVMLFYQVGEICQGAAVRKSKRSITDLMDIRPDVARVIRGGEERTVAPEEVKIGETIVVRAGEKIPLDGKITKGESLLDTSALTGESVPRKAKAGDEVLSGTINQSGLIEIETSKIFAEGTVAKIINLVQNASEKKAKVENFITVFARYYTPAVVGLAAALIVFPPLITGAMSGGLGGIFASGAEWFKWLHRGLIFLVISCPCALVISIPLGFFGGIGAASRNGILVKGGNYLEALGKLDTVVFDKTGTLTEGVFEVSKLLPAKGRSEAELLALAAAAEASSNHPIALSIIKAAEKTLGLEDLPSLLRGGAAGRRPRRSGGARRRKRQQRGVAARRPRRPRRSRNPSARDYLLRRNLRQGRPRLRRSGGVPRRRRRWQRGAAARRLRRRGYYPCGERPPHGRRRHKL